MTKRSLSALGLAALLSLSACTVKIDIKGPLGEKTIKLEGAPTTLTQPLPAASYAMTVEDIHIVSSGGISLVVDPALDDAIAVTGPMRLLETIEVKVGGGRIALVGDDDLHFTGGDLEVRVGAELVALEVETGIELEARLPDAKHFTLAVDGAIDGEIAFGTLDSLHVTVNGAGSLELEGRCADATLIVNGAGSLDADELICTKAAVTINGAGSCEIYADDTLDATVNGVGSIAYAGKPATVNKNGGGIASIREIVGD